MYSAITGLERSRKANHTLPCPLHMSSTKSGPVAGWLQAYISRTRLESFSLTADMMYISQNAPRIARALFEIALRRGWSSLAELMLTLSKVSFLSPAAIHCTNASKYMHICSTYAATCISAAAPGCCKLPLSTGCSNQGRLF